MRVVTYSFSNSCIIVINNNAIKFISVIMFSSLLKYLP
nr:MAG TPA: hypothetical protein [Bacteriophage sp.]DAI57854.1 MAG TPA: hypothetical protein [Caudoviricetes sp.]